MERTTPLGLSYPAEIYSLSHVALPFPMSDSLYGLYPDSSEDFGINLGAMASRGERGALIISLDSLKRLLCFLNASGCESELPDEFSP